MREFIAKHRDEITGVLSGFDRLVFRGTLRSISHVHGMDTYLAMNKVLRKDFGRHVQQVSPANPHARWQAMRRHQVGGASLQCHRTAQADCRPQSCSHNHRRLGITPWRVRLAPTGDRTRMGADAIAR